MIVVASILIFLSSLASADVYQFPEQEIHLSTSFQGQAYSIQLRDDESHQDLFYKPNVGSVFLPKLSYGDLFSVSWGFKAPVAEESIELYGETKYTDIRMDFVYHHFFVTANYSQYRGFYLDNTQAAIPSYEDGDPKVQRSNLYSKSLGVSLTWVWNPETFSLPALINQTERQEKWGGSVLFGGSFTETYFYDDSSLIPASLHADYDILDQVKGARFRSLFAKAGYGFSYARKWFIGSALMFAPGLTKRELNFTDSRESKGWEPSGRVEFIMSGGYNGNHFFAVINSQISQDFYLLTGSSTLVSPQLLTAGLTVGTHLGGFDFMDRWF